MINRMLTSSLLVAMLAGTATAQPQMCKEYLNIVGCHDAGCRWREATSTCTRQCHEFGGAVSPGTEESKVECSSQSIGCRVISHPTNAGVWKCGRLCPEFKVEMNCLLAGYSTCRWATGDITGGEPMCTKQCVDIPDKEWCEMKHCIWNPEAGTCRRKCIEFQMKGPCEAMGCNWVTPADGYALSQCIPPGQCPTCGQTFLNTTGLRKGLFSNASNGTYFFGEGKWFKIPTPTSLATGNVSVSGNFNVTDKDKGKQFLQTTKKH